MLATGRGAAARNEAGQGRPIGLLGAWLKGGAKNANQWTHVHLEMPTYHERVQAREDFRALGDRAKPFLDAELSGKGGATEALRVSVEQFRAG